jgi:hypothetical protein
MYFSVAHKQLSSFVYPWFRSSVINGPNIIEWFKTGSDREHYVVHFNGVTDLNMSLSLIYLSNSTRLIRSIKILKTEQMK